MQLFTTLTLLSAPMTFAPQEQVDVPELLFRPVPASGQTFSGSFELSRSEELVEWRQLQGGEEIPADMLPSMERVAEESMVVEFTETIAEVKDGAPSKINRTYGEMGGEIAQHMSFGDEGAEFGEPLDIESERSSVLVDESVVIALDEDEGQLVAKPAEGSELDEGDVAGVRGDMSLGLFSQPGDEPLAKGGSWELDAGVLDALLDYPGDVKLEGEGEHPMMDFEMTEESETEVEGKLVLTYSAVREIEGRATAVIEVSGEITRTIDATQEAMMMVEGDGAEPETAETQITTVETLTPRGELHWDIELGAFVRIELAIDTSAESSELTSFEIPQVGEIELEQVEVLEGSMELSYSRTPVS